MPHRPRDPGADPRRGPAFPRRSPPPSSNLASAPPPMSSPPPRDPMIPGAMMTPRLVEVSAMASSQNLPAVLNDPRKGKQKDFFTRTWGEDFSDLTPVPPSPYCSGALSGRPIEKYLRKLHKHCPRHTAPAAPDKTKCKAPDGKVSSNLNNNNNSITALPDLKQGGQPILSGLGSVSEASLPKLFLDPAFDLSNPETFGQVFPFLKKLEGSDGNDPKSIVGQTTASPKTGAGSNFCHLVESSRRLVQERLTHYLDAVEVEISGQVAQKSHHFFQVMTYHDALMTQLTGLVRHVKQLRRRLQQVDDGVFKAALNVARLKRKQRNTDLVLEKMSLMSSLHQTQPTIQLMLSGSAFSGALDLITTSRDVLAVDLVGIVSFRHLSSQLVEIQSIIGKILLADFQKYISDEIHRDVVREKASIICERAKPALGSDEADQLKSVIYGLLRQNSYTFLEVLEEASIAAVKKVFKEVLEDTVMAAVKGSDEQGSMVVARIGLATEFAQSTDSGKWTEFFDELIGSLISLLRRIHSIHTVILEAIASANEGTNGLANNVVSGQQPAVAIAIPEEQLKSLKVTSREVLVNVCDQVVERASKILAQRSKAEATKLITTHELFTLTKLVDILNAETLAMTGKISSGFQLSLQSQSLLHVQSFHEGKRLELSSILEREKWRKSVMKFADLESKMSQVPILHEFFFGKPDERAEVKASQQLEPNGTEEEQNDPEGQLHEQEAGPPHRRVEGDDKEAVTQSDEDVSRQNGPSNAEEQAVVDQPGAIRCMSIQSVFHVTDSAYFFTLMLCDYCKLSSRLPSVALELGLMSAELIKFYNSKICQLVLGVGAVSVSGLKTITIRNIALAITGLQLAIAVLPYVHRHFEAAVASSHSGGSSTHLNRQFEQASKHLANHVVELREKIVSVVDGLLKQTLSTWEPPKTPKQSSSSSSTSSAPPVLVVNNQLPSANFRALCQQMVKLHDAVVDIWSPQEVSQVILLIHKRFMVSVEAEVKARTASASLVSGPSSGNAALALADRIRGSSAAAAANFDRHAARVLHAELTFYVHSVQLLKVLPPGDVHLTPALDKLLLHR